MNSLLLPSILQSQSDKTHKAGRSSIASKTNVLALVTWLFKLNITLIILALSFLPHLAFASHYSSISYVISPANTELSAIRIETEIKGELNDQLIIDFPEKWAGNEYIEQVKNIKLYNADYEFSVNKDKVHQLTINIPNHIKSIKLSYDLHQEKGNPSDVHKTIIRPDLIHATGHGFLAIPTDLKEEEQFAVNIEWKNMPDDWNIISSHGSSHGAPHKKGRL